ncbi:MULTISPECIES: GntR family transcriptional regulator [unclassified Beijerinckia]|uniref:GntR family transcriptional regulator n=1 Tax=unclassified Beijerinckia TaxID=2638183 RepID=UPI000898AF06|nr:MULTISPECIES: GntR family transcriptional regulator [unclassified Beijerinckia]MDH7799243.1 DNA-binding GntR family transcriptional regulator [Beijerinckia sp. GAS462]SED90921.1 transcriptional regulator, GntR family [Beijerinckia sp. 28-YEA-48]
METTLSQTIAQSLAEQIVAGQLEPGRKLDEMSLAARFNVSRSPVRDALHELVTTQLVEYFPRRGFAVAHIEPTKLEDMFEAASEMEALAARMCALRASAADRSRIEFLHKQASAALDRNDVKAYAALNEDFHLAIYAGARNKTIEEMAINLRQRLAPFRLRVFFSPDRVQTSLSEHDAIVQAILAQNSGDAAQAMRDHSTGSVMNVMQHFSKILPNEAEPRRRRIRS